jgi:hypothetical protein
MPFKEILAGASHLLTVKWFAPGGVKVAGNGVSPPVERTNDWIAFSFLFSGVPTVYMS